MCQTNEYGIEIGHIFEWTSSTSEPQDAPPDLRCKCGKFRYDEYDENKTLRAQLAITKAALREIDEGVQNSKHNWNGQVLFRLSNTIQQIARRALQDMEKE